MRIFPQTSLIVSELEDYLILLSYREDVSFQSVGNMSCSYVNPQDLA